MAELRLRISAALSQVLFMDLTLWFLFVSVMGTLLLTPGPTILTVTSFTLTYGRAAVPYLVMGVAMADLIFITLGLAMHTALITVSDELFLVLKVFGLGVVGALAWRL